MNNSRKSNINNKINIINDDNNSFLFSNNDNNIQGKSQKFITKYTGKLNSISGNLEYCKSLKQETIKVNFEIEKVDELIKEFKRIIDSTFNIDDLQRILDFINNTTKSNNNQVKTYSSGPFIKDLFGIIPIKPGTNGTYYIEFGGTLQNQERVYFGPVNIRKMSIQLLNDRGDIVDLNGSNWSFSFICEQLYRDNST
jgi:hypothetical protein